MKSDLSEQPELKAQVSRRNFMKAATIATAGAAIGTTVVTDANAQAWNEEYDVVVVGSGGAALAAAAAAVHNGARVKVLEKAELVGGTTIKSGGVYWIPNNPFMVADGIADRKEDALRYMSRCAFPHLYRPDSPTFGMTDHNYRLMEVLYDRGGKVLQEFSDIGALKSVRYPTYGYMPIPDYYANLPENKAPRGRSVHPADGKGEPGAGSDLVGQLQAFIEGRGAQIALETAVVRAVVDENRKVLGVVARTFDGTELNIRARKGVIFGSGGFTQNPDMRETYLRIPVLGGCAVPTNQGDFVKIAIDLGAQLGNMNEAWLQQEVLDEVLEFNSVPFGVFFLGGDSMVMVNKFGRRTCNEKTTYNERTRSHLVWDPARGEYVNRLQFMIFDDHARSFGGVMIPPPGEFVPPYIITADTLEDLAKKIDEKLASYEHQIGHFRLDGNFLDGLKETLVRFKGFAETGKDTDYLRGEAPIDQYFAPPKGFEVKGPNPWLHPISDKGPYYAIVLAAGTLDTKGGAVYDEHSRVLDTHDQPIDGLYVAGNAGASPSGQSYWGAGGTLGLAITFGFIAGEHAARRS
ncbi:FAD-binding protein [Agrobacterium rhizogenes]|uniref:FAD-binding protein n=1 Tax=Rhizobium rhizogenes TaxID=359 RepID=UPI00115EE67D|nr:FAD-binding protein [Rhizobium rhizogenes]NTG90846.1 FAD-binding protein [Rhizobium rhizogenes]NTI20119.1 FAD-binding protein [Rhizobium rhizogenes]NTI39168.1 FAD-binding protein [Rhizobium rhizogenes]TRB19870.1 FAD-binding protein [Rhizobium rhizogenes]WEO69120.1 FAD-binding protein [Rhizobium rhizogenes]